MCRLCAATMTRINGVDDPLFKPSLVHEMMLRSSSEDGGQNDGWGATDGDHIVRSGYPYIEDAPTWLKTINPSNFIMTHIRKASAQTARTVQENHPYSFDINGERLIAAHNGWIDGTVWTNYHQGMPNTDSWRALHDLSEMMKQDSVEDLSGDLMAEWLSKYNSSSAYAFLFLWKQKLYAVRGDTRPLFVLESGDGYFINTSEKALTACGTYLHLMYGLEMSKPAKLADFSIHTFTLGSLDTPYETFKVTPVVRTYHNSHWNSGTYSGNYQGAAQNVNVRNAENVQGSGTTGIEPSTALVLPGSSGSVVYAPSVTTPRPRRGGDTLALTAAMVKSVSDAVKDPSRDLRVRRDKWRQVCGFLSPMRSTLTRLWAAQALGYITTAEEGLTNLKTMMRDCSFQDFALLESVLCTELADGGKTGPFNTTANLMLNWWNRVVRPGYDVEAHIALFGLDFFWLDPKYTTSREANKHLVLARWQEDMTRRVMESIEPGLLDSMFSVDHLIRVSK